MRVLIVEDESKIATLLLEGLREHGLAAEVCSRGDEALEKLRQGDYDAAVLDIMIPQLDGLSLIRQLRAYGSTLPVLMVSALGSLDERVAGINAGADDYLAKPFAVKEVVARVKALGRRSLKMSSTASATMLSLADLTLDLTRREVRRAGKRLELSTREILLLEVLLRHAGHICGRRLLLEEVWEYHFDQGSNLVDVYIRRLRLKLDQGHEIKLLHTVRGAGYLLKEGPP
ncbi:response regulator transcription factor [soil metagenome]